MRKFLFKLILRKQSKFQTSNLEVSYVYDLCKTLDNTLMHQKKNWNRLHSLLSTIDFNINQ